MSCSMSHLWAYDPERCDYHECPMNCDRCTYAEGAENIFTFWEGKMPAYIRLCMNTWRFHYTVLTYDNMHEYTDIDIEPLKRYTLPQIADVIRVHVLRDNGGYWLDADTIMVTDKLPTTNMIGFPDRRANTIGYLHTEPHSKMFEAWAKYQDDVIGEASSEDGWDIFGNRFTDQYVAEHPEITIASVEPCWPETYMEDGNDRWGQYRSFYFARSYHLADIRPTDMIMLHNSWTPDWYKKMATETVLREPCTLSNILRELNDVKH